MLSFGRLRRQAALLDRYCTLLRRDRAAMPPAGLDPDLAVVARVVEGDHELPHASSRFQADLWSRIEAQGGTPAWTGPAIGPHRRRRSVRETEEQHIMTATTDQPASLEQRRWTKELWKVAAAIVAFAVVGTVLVLLLRDNGGGEPQVVAPGPTATAAASPTIDVTATREPTQAAPTATAAGATSTAAGATATASTNSDPSAPGEIVAHIPVGYGPLMLGATDGAIWVPNSWEGTVSRIDPATNTVVATIPINERVAQLESPKLVATYEDQVWVSNDVAGTLVRIDPATNQIVQTITPAFTPADAHDTMGLLIDDTGIWVSADWGGDQAVIHLDPQTGDVLGSVPIDEPLGLASGFGSIWVVEHASGQLVRIDPATHAVLARIPAPGSPGPLFVAASEDAVWITQQGLGSVERIDPMTNQVVATIDTGMGRSAGIVAATSGIWVNDGVLGYIIRIDPATNEVSSILKDRVSSDSVGMTESEGSIWVAVQSYQEVIRIDPMP